MLAPLFAEEATGIGALGIDWTSLVVYLVNFVILLGLLYLVAYKPVLRMLGQRSRRVQDSLEEADRVRQEAQQQQQELERRLGEGRQEGQRLLEQARQMAERYREEELARARQEAEQFLAQAQVDIQRERDDALDQVRRHFADLAMRAAEQVIQRSLDRQAHREILERVLEESPDLRGS